MEWVVTGEACIILVSAAVLFVRREHVGRRWVSIAQSLKWATLRPEIATKIVAAMSVLLMGFGLVVIVLAWTVFEYAV